MDRGAWWATVHGIARRTEHARGSFLEASFILILSACSTVDPRASRAQSFTDFSSVYLYLVNYKRALVSPLQGLNHALLQLLIFNTLERSSGWRVEMRHSVLSQGRGWRAGSGRTGLGIIRYFQEPIL